MARPPDAHGPAATPGRRPEAANGSAGQRRRRGGTPPERLRTVWLSLPRERRLAAIAAFGLIFTLFLPWYQETVIAQGTTNLSSVSASLTGWGAFSFVEAAVLLVAAAVLALLFIRAEGAAFHVPGGDGGVITAAGVWTCLLIVWRMFDKEGTTGHGLYDTASGIEWGIFIALGVAALLTYAGSRIKLAHEPEPPLPGEGVPPGPRPSRPTSVSDRVAARRSRPVAAPDAPETPEARQAAQPARRRVRPSSLAEPRGARPPASGHEGAQTRLFPETPDPERRAPARDTRPPRGLDFRELEQIELDEPPEAPTVQRRAPDPEDPLTTRLNRPD
ncbi:MAG TPA: hypothetical protein VF781_02400 [Solirubrobacteraceae bacterium]